MKLFFVMVLLSIFLGGLIISLDLLMGTKLQGVIPKAINPFRVLETAEYIILMFFGLFFIFDAIGSYLKKRNDNSSPN